MSASCAPEGVASLLLSGLPGKAHERNGEGVIELAARNDRAAWASRSDLTTIVAGHDVAPASLRLSPITGLERLVGPAPPDG